MVRVGILLAVLLLSLAPLTIVGCGPMLLEPSAHQVFVDASYSGKEVDLAANDLLIVTLESNVTTGFSWYLVGIDDSTVLEMVSHEYQSTQPPGQTPLVGAGAKEVWLFRTLKAGATSFTMVYQRAWESDNATNKTFRLTVNVK